MCKMCHETHQLKLSRPLQIYCSKQSERIPTPKKYNHWNRPLIDFCMNCLHHAIGRNVGYCWFCTKCNLHQLNHMHGMNVTLYDETKETKYGGNFIRCFTCGRLRIAYDKGTK